MHRYTTFQMQDSGQYSINTEEAPRFAVEIIDKTAYIRVIQIRLL